MNKIWTDNERNFIRENASKMKDRELAEELSKTSGRNITIQSVRKVRQKMGIAKKHGRGICAIVEKEKQPVGIAVEKTIQTEGSSLVVNGVSNG